MTLTLSQTETLMFLNGAPVEIQLRVLTKDGQALASEIIEEPVGRILKDGEIT